MDSAELHIFYEDLVATLRDRGVVCAITSGLACVHYGLAETTKDCDLLCHPNAFGKLLGLLGETKVQGQPCGYRGHISPPLDGRWHQGGWTSHFEWRTEPTVTTLDVFGKAVRQTSPWEHELSGLYAGMNVVAEMKRTNREKDWPFITSLGTEMLWQRDPRGWLHLFDADEFNELQEECPIPEKMVAVRPALQLALNGDPKLTTALFVERVFWQELDRIRIRIYRAALRPFVLAMGRASRSTVNGLADQHQARVKCAETNLKPKPIAEYGVEPMIEAARASTAALVNPEGMQWLPNVRSYFKYLE
jgi:hypothetical protein